MIPTIGIMIGAYIFARMINQFKSGSGVEKVFVVITMVVAVIGSLSLLMK